MKLSIRTIRPICLTAVLASAAAVAFAGKLTCPDNPEDGRVREAVATSAPEIKVRAETRNDSRRWIATIKPLIQKAVKLAKAHRATAIQEGVEQACPASHQFVAKLVPVPERASGCEHRIVSRPAEGDYIYVQAIATCKYTFSCCMADDRTPRAGTEGAVGFTLEGPLSGTPASTSSSTSAAPPASPAKR